jgi:NADP-dependent 3-hydroxy acid dehydrogenase YdfG
MQAKGRGGRVADWEAQGTLSPKPRHPQASVYTVQLDLRNHDELMQLPCNLPEEFSKVDILVNNVRGLR